MEKVDVEDSPKAAVESWKDKNTNENDYFRAARSSGRVREESEQEQESECPDFCTTIIPVHPLRPNI